jgi:hypothetical protein
MKERDANTRHRLAPGLAPMFGRRSPAVASSPPLLKCSFSFAVSADLPAEVADAEDGGTGCQTLADISGSVDPILDPNAPVLTETTRDVMAYR